MNSDTQFVVYQTPLGRIKIGYTAQAVVLLQRTEAACGGEQSPLSDRAIAQLREYCAGERRTFDFPCEPVGTAFQRSVWQALVAIPYGETRSYKEIAAAVGNPRACRAVGMANHRNPLNVVIPCHRVIGTNGDPTGYAGGMEMKLQLLSLEQEHK